MNNKNMGKNQSDERIQEFESIIETVDNQIEQNDDFINHDIQAFLDTYKVDFPNEDEIEESIQYILTHSQPAERKSVIFKKRAKAILGNCVRELSQFGWSFWTLNSMFLILGVISIVGYQTNPYFTAFAMAPLPFLVGIVEILKSKDEGLVELEMTLKYNAGQIFVSRLVVVGLFNLLMNLTITAVTIVVNPEIIFIKFLLFWTIPFVVVTGIAFLFAIKTRGTIVSTTMISLWFALCFGSIQLQEVRDVLFQVEPFVLIGILLIGIFLWTVQIFQLNKWITRGESYVWNKVIGYYLLDS